MLGDFDLLDGAFVQGVSKNAINRVGRRNDEVALAEFVDNAGEVHEDYSMKQVSIQKEVSAVGA